MRSCKSETRTRDCVRPAAGDCVGWVTAYLARDTVTLRQNGALNHWTYPPKSRDTPLTSLLLHIHEASHNEATLIFQRLEEKNSENGSVYVSRRLLRHRSKSPWHRIGVGWLVHSWLARRAVVAVAVTHPRRAPIETKGGVSATSTWRGWQVNKPGGLARGRVRATLSHSRGQLWSVTLNACILLPWLKRTNPSYTQPINYHTVTLLRCGSTKQIWKQTVDWSCA